MARWLLVYFTLLAVLSAALPETSTPPEPRLDDDLDSNSEEPPEGYYAFVESPNATPPRVRPPPYRQVSDECKEGGRAHVSADNLCGDLNRGLIPRNPMGQYHRGEPYPFELIRNHTLRFLSRTLPVLRADATLPRVARLTPAPAAPARLEERSKRSAEEEVSSSLPLEHRSRDSKKFCDGGGIFCTLYRAINGDNETPTVERREDPGVPAQHHRYEGPPTPCPARVEYATPVFARNYQGVWRYVVQIPYEGYFTQTVELTRCMQSRCHYLEGGCLSSPRWVSLLVAELHYPTELQTPQPEYSQYAAEPSTEKPPHCDGHDDMGCFQVRLYYDWFLVPGSCKCWRPDYFARYVRRRQNNEL